MTRCACLVFALVLVAGSALANIPFPELCVLENAAGSDGAVVFVNPDGSGRTFDDARLAGNPVDATLTLTVVNNVGDPLANVAVEDMWIVSTGGGLVPCSMIYPDDVTDANGQASWVQSPNAGGNSIGEDAQAFIAGDPVPGPVAVQFVSSDINGDLQVNLSDIVAFTNALATYDAVADFNDDGTIDLSDISVMAPGIGTVCP